MRHFILFPLLFMGALQLVHQANAQARLDSIIRYTYTSNGNDSTALSKRFFDYDGNGQIFAERDLATSDFIHWRDAHRKKFIYNSKGQLERIDKENFIDISSSWRTYFYQEREYSSDSDYVVKYYEYFAGMVDTLPKFSRISLFSDGSRKSLTKRSSDNFSQRWITEKFDSLVMNYGRGVVIREYTAGKLFHYSGPANNFFRLDSITDQVFDLKYRSFTFKLSNPPAKRRIYITRSKKGPNFKEYYTSDSLVYFLNANGMPDSSYKYVAYWNLPQYHGLQNKNFYTWKGKQMTSYSTGTTIRISGKTGFSDSLGGRIRDTIYYKSNGIRMDKDTKERTLLDRDGHIQSISYYRWSSIVDSFSINEKDIYYYSDPATSNRERNLESSLISVFPNPSAGIVHISNTPDENLLVYNTQGRLLKHIAPSPQGMISFPEKGVYLLKQTISGQVVRIVIQ